MQKKMKLITTGSVLGVFVLWNYIFEWLSKIGASIVSAVLSEQLPPEAWNSQLYGAIAKQSLPFVLMIILGAALIYWSKGKEKALAAENAEWAQTAPQRRASQLASAGGILAAVAVFALVLPTYMNFQDLVMAFSSPEGIDYIMKMMVPNYIVLLAQLFLGLWLVFGMKEHTVSEDISQEEHPEASNEESVPCEASEDCGVHCESEEAPAAEHTEPLDEDSQTPDAEQKPQ